jgi:hypothetical protein
VGSTSPGGLLNPGIRPDLEPDPNTPVLIIYYPQMHLNIIFLSVPRPPLLSSGQSSWLQIQRSRVLFPALLDFLRSIGSGRGPLSLVRIIEELLERKVAAPV